jgi:uncharacterized protein YndB with AHSA1/START domain
VQEKFANVGDDAVRKRTGKSWAEWFELLDSAGARSMNHTEIAACLYERLNCPGWWNQMVAVGYEQSRGLRQKHERPDGYSISVSRVVASPVTRLFAAWNNAPTRTRWLGRTRLTIRKETANKSMRVTWSDNKTSLEVNFYAKGRSKSQVVVQHSKLADADACTKMKAFWAKSLDKLKTMLETGRV